MRTETITRVIKSFDELTDDEKDKVIEVNFENAWHFEHNLQERIETLKKLAERLGTRLDYSICCVPDRGEHITMHVKGEYHDNESEMDLIEAMKDFVNDEKDCPLTGVCYDEDIRDFIKKRGYGSGALSFALTDYLNAIHKEYQYTLSHEYIGELCEGNDYEFYTDNWKMA